ncbi:PilN domain-containing protein [Alkanindiges sp. WGS2144]|uniref:PilN domain-containing protein n=1 Tax=Alkanindiges sp. WGS2144 TaxID=3366808 RepID=UPI003752BD52
MAKINLLPWREALREQRKKEFISISVGMLLLGLVLSVLMWAFFHQRLNDQQQANQLVQEANSQLDVQLKSLDGLQARRDEIIERMKLIQDLQGKRPVVVRLFDEITRLTPSQMYLDRFERKDNKFTLQGRAESPNTVSEFLRNLEGSPWFRNAFMNSYQGPDAQQKPPSGSVLPRPEDSYGSFVVTVDISDEAASLTPEVLQETANPVDAAATVTGGQ